MSDNGSIPIVAKIEIVMTADGQVGCKAQAPNHMTILGMMEAAKLSIDHQFREQAKQQQIHLPPLGLQVPRA